MGIIAVNMLLLLFHAKRKCLKLKLLQNMSTFTECCSVARKLLSHICEQTIRKNCICKTISFFFAFLFGSNFSVSSIEVVCKSIKTMLTSFHLVGAISSNGAAALAAENEIKSKQSCYILHLKSTFDIVIRSVCRRRHPSIVCNICKED